MSEKKWGGSGGRGRESQLSSPAVASRLAELWGEGYTVAEIADEFGVTKQTVYTWGEIAGLRIRRKPRKPSAILPPLTCANCQEPYDSPTGSNYCSAACRFAESASIAGLVSGKLTAIRVAGSRLPREKLKKVYWLCQCECGRERIVAKETLKQGNITSCESPECRRKRGPKGTP